MRRVRARAAVVLPEPLSPTTATVSPGWMEKERFCTATTDFALEENSTRRWRTSRRGLEEIGIRKSLRVFGFHFPGSRNRGSTASRRASPRRLKAITVRMMARPGVRSHQKLSMKILMSWAWPSMSPHEEEGSWMPRPRKLRAASPRM